MTVRTVLLTRPYDDSVDIARDISGMGFEPVIAPLLTIEPIPHDAAAKPDAMVFTSANGVRHLNTDFFDVPVFTVGDMTAQAAREKGYANVISADGTVNDIRDIIPSAYQNILYVRGADVSQPPWPDIHDIIVYRAVKVDNFSDDTKKSLSAGTFDAAMFFSPRTAEHFVSLTRKNRLETAIKPIKALCLSGRVVESVSALPWIQIDVATTPTRRGMLDLLKRIMGE